MPEIHYIVNWTDLGYNPLMPAFYTSTGDDGNTGLLQEGRVPKNHPIPEAVGTIDEASSVLGMARALVEDAPSKMMILTIQRDLYNLMAEVSASPNNSAHFRAVDSERVEWLEQQVELLTTKVKVTKEFIVPGDSFTGAVLDLARTVVRRARAANCRSSPHWYCGESRFASLPQPFVNVLFCDGALSASKFYRDTTDTGKRPPLIIRGSKKLRLHQPQFLNSH